MATYQVQGTYVDNDGAYHDYYMINRASDVKVGKLNKGTLELPGSINGETLAVSLMNIKAFLSNLSNIASEAREVSDDTTSTSSINIASSKAVNAVKSIVDVHGERLDSQATEIAGKAPIMHAVSDLTYGGATGERYGHVKLSDVYATNVPNSGAQNSVGASQLALSNAYIMLDANKSERNHASTSNQYGLATETMYGHVKLSDDFAESAGGATDGVAASSLALFHAYMRMDDEYSRVRDSLRSKADKEHSSNNPATYGAGTASAYGHVKLTDDYSSNAAESVGGAANSVAGSWYAIYRAYTTLSAAVGTKLGTSHADARGTSVAFGHVLLSDDYSTPVANQAAANSVGVSHLALYNCYAFFTGQVNELKKSVADGKAMLVDAIRVRGGGTTSDSFNSIADGIGLLADLRYSAGVGDADSRVNTDSQSYKTGHKNGVTDADNRVNKKSASYNEGYIIGSREKENEWQHAMDELIDTLCNSPESKTSSTLTIKPFNSGTISVKFSNTVVGIHSISYPSSATDTDCHIKTVSISGNTVKLNCYNCHNSDITLKFVVKAAVLK